MRTAEQKRCIKLINHVMWILLHILPKRDLLMLILLTVVFLLLSGMCSNLIYKGYSKLHGLCQSSATQAKSLEKELRWQMRIIVLYTNSRQRKWYRQTNLLFELFASIRRRQSCLTWGARSDIVNQRSVWSYPGVELFLGLTCALKAFFKFFNSFFRS